MTTALRILSIPFVVVMFVAFQLWVLVENMPAYARNVWWDWRSNTRTLARYIRIAFRLEAE
jgi:hypothetical protein